MRLEKISIGENEETKKKAILDNLGRQVIIEDLHDSFGHAVLLHECDSKRYGVSYQDRGERKLHYDDLQTLIILHPVIKD